MSVTSIYEKGHKCEGTKTEEQFILERLKRSYERGREYLINEELVVYEAVMRKGLEKAIEDLRKDKNFVNRIRNKARHPNGITELVAFRDLCILLDSKRQDI